MLQRLLAVLFYASIAGINISILSVWPDAWLPVALYLLWVAYVKS